MKMVYLATLFNLTIFFYTSASAQTLAAGETIMIQGELMARPCNIDPEPLFQTVDLKTVNTKTLYRYGHSTAVPFFITLKNCNPILYKTANITFMGEEDRELTGKLAVNNGTKGVAIVLFDSSGQEVSLNQPTAGTALVNGNNKLEFSAYLQGRPSAIKDRKIVEGPFDATVSFLINYR
ncbi:fimbrial protein [Serratia aquatilis]|uniref:Fimbrial protein n=1 Tax=Serratia aquatilis TaxID=1737515 RepID=A0ABV6EK53_9GAMM